jgi:ABC-type lipoprotein release transport system permease subunit
MPLQPPAGGLSAAIIGIIVGCSVGGVILIAIAAYMIRRRRLLQQQSNVVPTPPPSSAPPIEMFHIEKLPAETDQRNHVVRQA